MVDNSLFFVNSHLITKKEDYISTYPLIHAPNDDSLFLIKFLFYYNIIDSFGFSVLRKETNLCLFCFGLNLFLVFFRKKQFRFFLKNNLSSDYSIISFIEL